MDPGSKFKSEFKKYFTDHNVRIRVGLTNRHKSQALVETKNKYIGSILHRQMTNQELLSGKENKEWIENLPILINLINKNLPEPITKEISENIIITPQNKNILSEGTKVRIMLDYPQDINGNKLYGKFRSSDIRFSREVYKIKQILLKPGFPVMYLTNADSVARTKHELLVMRS